MLLSKRSCDELGVCQSVTKPCPPHTICARKSSPFYFAPGTIAMNKKYGYLRRAVLWWLLEQGQLTMLELKERIPAPSNGAGNACQALKRKRLISEADEKGFAPGDERRRTVYGLTRSGIELALTLDRPAALDAALADDVL